VDSKTEVLIAGAGPVGLALALELQRFGVRFRIVEKKAERSATSKALGLQPRLSEVFAILGLQSEFDERGFGNVRAVNFHSGRSKLLTIVLRAPADQVARNACQPRMLIIPQSVTEEILERALAKRGQVVERRCELVNFQQDADSVRGLVRHEDGGEESISSQFLVSCEGAHSLVRKQAGFSFSGTTMPMRFLLADVTIDWDLPENEVQVWFHRNGVIGALPFGGQKWRLIIECAENANVAAAEPTLAVFRELAAERVGRPDFRIRDPIWLSDFRINARMVDRFRDGRVFVAGDAAHIHSPLGGQGIATGIQDASNVAWKLSAVLRDGAPHSLLDTYEEERKPIARTVLRGTTAASKLVFAMNPVLRFVRERGVFPILRTAFVQRQLFRKVSQLEIRYRGTLAANSKAGSSPVRIHWGQRAPDVAFGSSDGEVTLFELLRRFGWIAFLGHAVNNQQIAYSLGQLNVCPFVVSVNGDLQDTYSDFARLYGARNSFLYLVRPDGHIGLFQPEPDTKGLASYLKKIRAEKSVNAAFA
jgi:2-polyprenyl-6-methoxyphenol hydroxylase-like FAD-dependent oxidoreductase